jgi:ATP-dependent Lon protease
MSSTKSLKLLFPDGLASKDEVEMILKLSIEGRKRVKDQLMRIDKTYEKAIFSYSDETGQVVQVTTTEELGYPDLY